jgi:hypothetical protein
MNFEQDVAGEVDTKVDTRFSEAGLRNQTKPRDAASVNTLEVRFTDPSGFIEVLEEDGRAGAITDSVVWISRTAGPAEVCQIVAGHDWDHRIAPAWRALCVEVSYLARNQLHKGSFYCGVALKESNPQEKRTVATALRLAQMELRMQAAVGRASRLFNLRIRGGGALHLFNLDQPWQAHPDQHIAKVPELTCAHCQEVIYWSNGAWRHKSTGREAATKLGTRVRGNSPVVHFDHAATPAEEVTA